MSVLTVNLPQSLHDKLREAARQDHSTPELLATLAIAEKVSSLLTVEYLEKRASRAKVERFAELLAKVPDVEPEDYDKL